MFEEVDSQYGLSGNGLDIWPFESQYRPPFYNALEHAVADAVARLPLTEGMYMMSLSGPIAQIPDLAGKRMGSNFLAHTLDLGS